MIREIDLLVKKCQGNSMLRRPASFLTVKNQVLRGKNNHGCYVFLEFCKNLNEFLLLIEKRFNKRQFNEQDLILEQIPTRIKKIAAVHLHHNDNTGAQSAQHLVHQIVQENSLST